MTKFLLVRHAHGLAGGTRAASFFSLKRAKIRQAWVTTLHEMVAAWALQHGVELVGSGEPARPVEPKTD